MKTNDTKGLSPAVFVGIVSILLPIFIFMVLQSINRQESFTRQLIVEKGTALIRSLEAGTRAGMMGENWGNSGLQYLLEEMSLEEDIAYIQLIDGDGGIIAHSDTGKTGQLSPIPIDMQEVAESKKPLWRLIDDPDGNQYFEVIKSFRPSGTIGRIPFNTKNILPEPHIHDHNTARMRMFFQQFGFMPATDEVFSHPFIPAITIGFNTGTLAAAKQDDQIRAVTTGIILFLISALGMAVLFFVSNHRKTRSLLSEIRAFSDSVLEHIPIGLVAFDSDGVVTSINPFAISMLELKQEKEFIGTSAKSILPSSLWEQSKNMMQHQRNTLREVDCLLESGKSIPLEIDFAGFRSKKTGVFNLILLFRDLTQVRNLQKEVARNQRLASIGRLAAGVAHEIRNPLSSIKGFATFFRDHHSDTPKTQMISRIMIEEVERMDRVIGQLLELAKPVAIRKKPVELSRLIADSIRLIEEEATKRKIRVSIPEEQPGKLSLDEDKVRQVLLNLYLNAMDAIEDGGKLEVKLNRDSNSESLQIIVSDSGRGISSEDLPRIYDPYFTTKQSGTGLGLAIVHNIIQAHGGKIVADSSLGIGSTFTISIPDTDDENEVENTSPALPQ